MIRKLTETQTQWVAAEGGACVSDYFISKKKKAKRRTRREKYTARHSRAQTGHRQGKQQPNPRATEAREKGKRERREGEKGRGGEEGRGKGGAGRGGGGEEGRGGGEGGAPTQKHAHQQACTQPHTTGTHEHTHTQGKDMEIDIGNI